MGLFWVLRLPSKTQRLQDGDEAPPDQQAAERRPQPIAKTSPDVAHTGDGVETNGSPWSLKKILKASGAVVSIGLLVVNFFLWLATKKTADIAKATLEISQQGHVDVGRKDGVVAEVVAPPDKQNDNSGIVLYFQNAGHLSAPFNWGFFQPQLGVIPASPNSPEVVIKSDRQFEPMFFGVNRSNGQISARGMVSIPGESSYATTVVELPDVQLQKILRSNPPFSMMGAYDYCDGVGNYSCKLFQVTYRGEPYNRFFLETEMDCPMEVVNTPSKPVPGFTYLPPCDLDIRKHEMERLHRMLSNLLNQWEKKHKK